MFHFSLDSFKICLFHVSFKKTDCDVLCHEISSIYAATARPNYMRKGTQSFSLSVRHIKDVC